MRRTLTCQMRGASDDHSPAQEGVGVRCDPGPLCILCTHLNRKNMFYKHGGCIDLKENPTLLGVSGAACKGYFALKNTWNFEYKHY